MSLSEVEQDLLDELADVAQSFSSVIAHGPTRAADLAEMGVHVHALQNMVLAQSAARVYPDRYRLMGATLLPAHPLLDLTHPYPREADDVRA